MCELNTLYRATPVLLMGCVCNFGVALYVFTLHALDQGFQKVEQFYYTNSIIY
jgi:hypothetical protein